MSGTISNFSDAFKLYLLILTLLNIQLSAAKSLNFKLKLIHRDSPESPLYPGNLSSHERIQRYIEYSRARASYLMSPTAGMRNSTVQPKEIQSDVKPYAGVYMVNFGIGTPAQEYWFAFDTASDLTWIQCEPCTNCYKQDNPIFDSRKSKSFRAPGCSKNEPCNPTSCPGGKGCFYLIEYGDGTTTRGDISVESFTFTDPDQVAPIPFDMRFGCSHGTYGALADQTKISGILAMDMHPTSLMGQYGDRFLYRFSYCLVPPASSGKSYLRFGADTVFRRDYKFQKTPIVKKPGGSNFYFLNLLDFSINGSRLNLPPDTFTFKNDGSGGCMIDTGLTITSVENTAFLRLKDEFKKYFAKFGVSEETNCPRKDIMCFKLVPYFNSFPSITYHLDGGDLTVDPKDGYLFEHSYFFPAFMAAQGSSTIGAWHQQNNRIVYDLRANQLLFAHTDCEKENQGS